MSFKTTWLGTVVRNRSNVPTVINPSRVNPTWAHTNAPMTPAFAFNATTAARNSTRRGSWRPTWPCAWTPSRVGAANSLVSEMKTSWSTSRKPTRATTPFKPSSATVCKTPAFDVAFVDIWWSHSQRNYIHVQIFKRSWFNGCFNGNFNSSFIRLLFRLWISSLKR